MAANDNFSRLQTIHAAFRQADGWYTAECFEIAVVTQGRTLDQAVKNLRAAVALHLDGGHASLLGMETAPWLHITFETGIR